MAASKDTHLSPASIKREVKEWVWIILERSKAWDEKQVDHNKWLAWERIEAAYLAFRPAFSPAWGRDWDSRVANHIKDNLAMRECAIAFLELDPWFHRSGYIKAKFLERLKSCPLNKSQVTRLNAVLIDAVHHRPGREFRRYGRLAARIASEASIRKLEDLSKGPGAVASRARLMQKYVNA